MLTFDTFLELLMAVTLSEFELNNAGAGPSVFRLTDVLSDDEIDALVLLLQRDYHCRKCRDQVQEVAGRYDEFEAENALVVSILPVPQDRVRRWQQMYELPFPLLADPGKSLGDELEQPTRFGVLGNLHDVIGRMPEALVVDVQDDDPTVTYVHKGASPTDRPSIDELLEAVRQLTG